MFLAGFSLGFVNFDEILGGFEILRPSVIFGSGFKTWLEYTLDRCGVLWLGDRWLVWWDDRSGRTEWFCTPVNLCF